MSSAVDGGAWVYWSFAGTGGAGWYIIGGTSEATPIFLGIVALADQVAGHPLGWLYLARTRSALHRRRVRGTGLWTSPRAPTASPG